MYNHDNHSHNDNNIIIDSINVVVCTGFSELINDYYEVCKVIAQLTEDQAYQDSWLIQSALLSVECSYL